MSAPQHLASSTSRIVYQPPGAVAAAYLADTSFIAGIMGPVGSGKTTTTVHRILRHALEQRPSTRDGVARSRWVAIRETYRQLADTTIPSWQQVVNAYAPPGTKANVWTGGRGDPARNILRFVRADGVTVEIEMLFVALGDQKIEDVLRGFEMTGAWLNEADRLHRDVLQYLRGRVGRYPSAMDGGPSYVGILLDYNAPDTDNYLYQLMEEGRPENVAFFRQPSGLAPGAENIANLPADYYARQMEGAAEWYIRRMVRNEYGYSRDGLPVFEEFHDSFHVASQKLVPLKHCKLVLGLDAGRTPSAIPLQEGPGGQIRQYPGLIIPKETSCGAQVFGERLVKFLDRHFPGLEVMGVCDPAAQNPGDQGESSWMEIVAAVAGIRIKPAPTNNIDPRLEAVRQPLTRLLDNGTPGFLLCPTARVERKAFNSGYRYRRIAVGGVERFDDVPEKNEFSHPMDGLQYGCLGIQGFAGLLGRRRDVEAKRALRRQSASMRDAYDPFS